LSLWEHMREWRYSYRDKCAYFKYVSILCCSLQRRKERKRGAKTMYIFSLTRLILPMSPWKQNRLSPGRPLLVTEYRTTMKSVQTVMSVSTKSTFRYNLCGLIHGDGLHKLLKFNRNRYWKYSFTAHQIAGRIHNTDINNKSFEKVASSDIFGTTENHKKLVSHT
jgi:hypothetical protein